MNRQGKSEKRSCPERSRRVFVGMSGGVDSSVAAYLLKKQGYDVVGVFMRSYNIDGCAERDAEDARRVAEKLSIPFYVFDFEDEYKKKVVEYMIDGYRRGITPNPDVMCNKEIKFGIFLEKALEMGALACRQAGIFVATGHYVIKKNDSLFAAKDKNKDQSYFLWALSKKQIEKSLFPVGNLLKPEVREIAKKAGLPTADKKDSQGICFLGKVTLDEFLEQYIPKKTGKVLNSSGKILGEHQGAHFYTIGQRHGLSHETWNMKIATKSGSVRKPFFVADKNIETNTIIVTEGGDSPVLYKKEAVLSGVNFISPNFSKNLNVFARVRYRQPLAAAKLIKLKNNAYKLVFDQPVKFVAPGQSAVFYSKNGEMLGGGLIL